MRREIGPEARIAVVYCAVIAYCIASLIYGIFGQQTPYSWALIMAASLSLIHSVALFVVYLKDKEAVNEILPAYTSMGFFITGTFMLLLGERILAYGFCWFNVFYDTTYYLFVLSFLLWRSGYVKQTIEIYERLNRKDGG